MKKMNELFVLSFQRSGSNWLHRCLSEHEDIFIGGELNPSANLLIINGIKTGDHVSDKLIRTSGALFEGSRKLIRTLMWANVGEDESAHADGEGYICDKTAFPFTKSLKRYPEQFEYIDVLERYFTDCKRIMIIRDIRDVIVSYTEWKNEESSDLLRFTPRSIIYFHRSLRNWCELHEKWLAGHDAKNELLVIQYSDMKNNFDAIMEDVFSYLDIEFDESFIVNLRNKYYNIDSKVYQEENQRRGYSFFRGGREGDWKTKFSLYHRLVVSLFYDRRISKILSCGSRYQSDETSQGR